MEAGSSLVIASLPSIDRYELVKDIGFGTSGVARLMRDRMNGELVAVKFIERGEKIDENVEREIINHRSLHHPNIIRFKQVMLTPTHLAIVMEYAAGGELYERICRAGRFHEDEARFFFQQLISGVSYCHSMEICHRDLKLENSLLDGNAAPRLKICDFGYSKSSLLHSQPKSTFQYKIPEHIQLSAACEDLLSKIFVANPEERITMDDIHKHPWFLKNLPDDLVKDASWSSEFDDTAGQTVDAIMRIIAEARLPAAGTGCAQFFDGPLSDADYEGSELDMESSGEIVCAMDL